MKRRLQLYLERTYGSAYGGTANVLEASWTSKQPNGDSAKGKAARIAKRAHQPQTPPDGGRFDLRCAEYFRSFEKYSVTHRYNTTARVSSISSPPRF